MNTISQPTYAQLLAENQRLRADQRGLHIDLEKEKLRVRDLGTPELQIDRLDVSIPGLAKIADPLLHLSNFTKPGAALPHPDMSQLDSMPMTVEDAHVRLPENSLNQVLKEVAVDGTSDLKIQLGQDGDMKLKGNVKKSFLRLPFSVEGHLQSAGDKSVSFNLEKTKIGGFIPVPRLVTDIFACLASQQLAKAHVHQDGDDFVVDMAGYIPKNVNVAIHNVTTQDGFLVVDAGRQGSAPL